ncbi:TPA: hypothetical protein UM343_002494 [Stenotrophomonas maltophilia]|nr:hypothetical protein [Stenotrophomonas maltophilia]
MAITTAHHRLNGVGEASFRRVVAWAELNDVGRAVVPSVIHSEISLYLNEIVIVPARATDADAAAAVNAKPTSTQMCDVAYASVLAYEDTIDKY